MTLKCKAQHAWRRNGRFFTSRWFLFDAVLTVCFAHSSSQLYATNESSRLRRFSSSLAGAGPFEAGGSWPLRSDVPFPQPCPWPVSEGFSLVTAPSPVGSVTAGSHTRVSFSGYLCQDAVLGTRCGSHVRNSSRSPQWVQTSAEHHVWHWYGCRSCRIIFSKITYRTWLESAN